MNLRERFEHIKALFTKEKLKPLLSMHFWWRQIKLHKKKILFAIGIMFFILLAIPIVTYAYFAGDLKDKESITNRSKTGLTLTDESGKTFFTFYHPKSVTYIPLSDMPEHLREAVIAAEDQDFYNNPGFSVTGMARAFVRNLMAGRIVEGGSTISQELVKISLLNSHRNYLRKYQELVLATELNRRFNKEAILEMYLNSVYFGEGAFGIENAAQAYFGIPAKELTLAQATMLVGLIPAPSAYSPISGSAERAERRQTIVLNQMAEEGYITKSEAEEADNDELVYNPTPQNETNVLAPHFALYVKDLVTKQYGEERVIRDGFIVKTTLNSEWQQYAEQVVQRQVNFLVRNKATNAAVVAIDPTDGAIKVMVGSHDWADEENGKINMSLRPRQPGSSFKPIIYADALEQHIITPATILKDKPVSYGDYKPMNYDKRFRGDVTVRRALATSLNVPAVEVMNMLGVSEGVHIAEQFGITTLTRDPSEYGLSLVLGSGEVPLLEMTNAYAVFADQGRYHTPYAIIEIKDKYGQDVTEDTKDGLAAFFNLFNIFSIVAEPNQREERTVISDETAFLISSILSDNNARTEVFGGALTISRPAAVKTGTTNDYRDALTIGYTPGIVVGVWVGNNDNSEMDNVAGSLGAAPIWRQVIENILRGTPLQPFIKPASIVKVAPCISPIPTGDTTTPASSPSAEEFFIRGTEPEACPTPVPSPTNEPSETPTPTPTNEPTPTPAPTEVPTPTDIPTPTSILPTIPLTPAITP